jgi:hypothetical protein
MSAIFLALLLLVSGCTAATHESARPAPKADSGAFGLAPASAPLVFPDGTREITLAWLVDELARSTTQEIACDPSTREELERTKEWLDVVTPVPAGEVYAFVEALLTFHGYALGVLKAGEPAVLGIFGGQAGRRPSEPVYTPIPEEELDTVRRHPAFLFQYAMHFENIDTRQLQTQLRQLLVDTSGLNNVVPAGERSLILQGNGARLAGLFQLLREVDRYSAAPDMPAQTQAEQAARPR